MYTDFGFQSAKVQFSSTFLLEVISYFCIMFITATVKCTPLLNFLLKSNFFKRSATPGRAVVEAWPSTQGMSKSTEGVALSLGFFCRHLIITSFALKRNEHSPFVRKKKFVTSSETPKRKKKVFVAKRKNRTGFISYLEKVLVGNHKYHELFVCLKKSKQACKKNPRSLCQAKKTKAQNYIKNCSTLD